VKVLYIGGAGRSGSTVLDALLGSADGWLSCGELTFMWQYGLLRGGRCSCGAPLAECVVWAKVFEVAGHEQPLDPARMVALRKRFRSTHLPLMASERITRRRLDALEEFPDVVERVYRAAAELTGARVLVDSSKEPHYSAILRERTKLDVYFLHLVRDPRAVAHSWQRRRGERGDGSEMERRGVLKTSLYYVVSNSAAELLWRGRPDRYRLVRYEDLLDDPVRVVGEIAELIDEPIELGQALAARSFDLGETHITWGNPNRFARGRVQLRSDDAWRDEQSAWRAAALAALNLPLAGRYGYPWRSGRPLTAARSIFSR
jgi:hypothetical protein